MKITITLELTEPEARQLVSNSLERVLNTAETVGHAAESSQDVRISELGSILWQDANELKPLADRLWREARDAVRATKW